LPPGAFDLELSDFVAFFKLEIPVLRQWLFTAEDAIRINQPVLSVVGMETADMFQESHALIKQWIPHAEELVIPQATHALQYMNPSAVAEGLARFLSHLER
jgi:pimeloyl-ACP methyl ester carboxylesterase